MLKKQKEAIVEAVKELLRVVLLAVVPFLIAGIENGSLNARAVGVVALLALLRGIDKLVHEWGKATKNVAMEGGLTRF